MSLPPSAERRSKTVTPDSHKDERYWERRNKNNLAAKKSRDSRRAIEKVIRQKVFELEKENTFLRRQLSLFKAHFGIPENQSLSPLVYRNEYKVMKDKSTDYSETLVESTKINFSRSYFSANAEKVATRRPDSDLFGSYRRPPSADDDDQERFGADVYFYTGRRESVSTFSTSSQCEEDVSGRYDDVRRSLCEDYSNNVTDLSMKKRTRSVDAVDERACHKAVDERACYDDRNDENDCSHSSSWCGRSGSK